MGQLYSLQTDDETIPERCESFGGGMDGYSPPTLLPPDAYQLGENIVVPDTFKPRTRPGADLYTTTFAHRIQGLFYFDTPTTEQLIVGENTKLFKVTSDGTQTEITGFTLTNADVDFSADQGVDKMMVVDGTTVGIWDGAAWATDATGGTETDPPLTASIVLWHADRMWAAGFPGGTTGKENDAIWASALETFGKGDWNKTDRNFRVGKGTGDPIVGLASLSSDAQRGFIMAVLKENSIWLVNTDPRAPATAYSATMGPEKQSESIGVVGKRAFCVYKNDLIFVAPDHNIYSLARMQAAAAQHEIAPPLSLPMQPYMDRINWTVASKIAAWTYKQLILFAVPLDTATTPNTVLVFNGRLQRWVAVWTGWTPNSWETTRFSGVHKLMHGDNVGNVRVWKDYADQGLDSTYLDDGTAIAAKLWTRSLLFGDPVVSKSMFNVVPRYGTSNAIVHITAVGDAATLAEWDDDVRQGPPNLPIDLPFDLTADTNIPKPKRLRGKRRFNEMYLKLESTSGWWNLQNISFSAFLNCVKNSSAT